MPRFDDTPKWKRELRWDADTQELILPPTQKQLDYLADLYKVDRAYIEPRTREEAAKLIDRGKQRRRANGKRKRKRLPKARGTATTRIVGHIEDQHVVTKVGPCHFVGRPLFPKSRRQRRQHDHPHHRRTGAPFHPAWVYRLRYTSCMSEQTRGERVRAARKRARLSQHQLAEQAGCGRSTIAFTELDARVPSLDAALAIAAVLGESVEDLFGPSTNRRDAGTPQHKTYGVTVSQSSSKGSDR